MRTWERVRESLGGFVITFWVGLAAIVGLFVASAELQDHADTSEVCTSHAALRVPDTDCTGHRPGDTWVYYRAGLPVPPVGGSTAGASTDAPAGSAVPGTPETGGPAAPDS
ncbi:hypothetical protein [Actinomycetospora sp. NBRC 106378]|uniref:hypothetical protein n=1 Tax=Actinomycetospora sp. NBRC 106378 TaxID=3032208 RepID=UPI0024A2E7AA|nr:hypothetical protein [Actinomycetospora sp. NBRC 106378]GLZ53157.1 hypothetical protein Acsp07_27740 [Actinomycetospora sp. NBRC 106378]